MSRLLKAKAAAAMVAGSTNAPMPEQLQIEVGGVCNSKCVMCARELYPHELPQMTVPQFKRILEQIPTISGVNLAGNSEPTLNPWIFNIIGECVRNGVEVSINTNAIHIEHIAGALVNSGLREIKVSVDAVTPETYRKVRGVDKFEDVCRGLDALHKAKIESGRFYPPVVMNNVLLNDNFHEIAEMPEFCREHGIDELNVKPCTIFDWEHRDRFIGKYSVSEIKAKLLETLHACNRHNIHNGIEGTLRALDQLEWQFTSGREERTEACPLPWSHTFINSDGTVRPCCFCYDDIGVMGNIFEQSFQEIWRGHEYRMWRKMHLKKNFPDDYIGHRCGFRDIKGMLKAELWRLKS